MSYICLLNQNKDYGNIGITISWSKNKTISGKEEMIFPKYSYVHGSEMES